MASNTLEIPMPRLRPQIGGVVLLVTFTAAIILYTNVIHQQIYLLNWIKAHDVGWSGGFGLLFDTELLKTSWLPTLLYRSPHHQLAIAASIMDITVGAIVMVLFVVSAFIKKNLWQNWILVGLFVPAFALTSIAFLYNFIEHDITGRLDSYYLYQIASPTEYHPYGANWMDFENWSCDIAGRTLESKAVMSIWDDNCHRSQLARWLLLPSWLILGVTIFVSWFVFRGIPSWGQRLDDEDEVEGGERRVRLP